MAPRIASETLTAIQPQIELLARIYEASQCEGVLPGIGCGRWAHLANTLQMHCAMAEQAGSKTVKLPPRTAEGAP